MTVLTRLTLRQIRAARGRFLLTVLGALLSAALLTAVLVGCHSVLRSLYAAVEAQNGAYHWCTQNLPAETAAGLLADAGLQCTGAVSCSNPLVTAGGVQLPLVRAAGRQLEMQNTRVVAGQLPGPGQALIPAALAEAAGLAPGDTLVYTGPDGTHAVPVSGIYGQSCLLAALPAQAAGAAPVYLQLDAAALPAGQEFTVYAAAQPLQRRAAGTAFFRAADAAAARLQQQGYGSWYNQALLSFSGEPWVRPYDQSALKVLLGGLRAFLLALIAAASALLVVNSFSISLAERRRTLGLLASAGATPRQKAGFLWRETALVALCGIPAGLAAGCLGVQLAFALVQPLVDRAAGWLGGQVVLRVFPNGALLAAAALLTAAVLVLAAWRPARQAAAVSAIDAIRQRGAVRVRRTRGREGALFGRLFGPAGVLAARLARRCHHRYRATVCSLTVVVTLFIAAAGATLYIERNFLATHDVIDYPAELYLTTDGTARPDARPVWQQLLAPQTPVEAVELREEIYWGSLYLRADQLTEAVRAEAAATDRGYAMQPTIRVLPDEEYAALAGAPGEPSGECLPVVVANRLLVDGDFGSYELDAQTALAPGDTLAWDFNAMPLTLAVQAVTDRPDYAGRGGTVCHMTLYTSRSAAQAVFDAWYAARGGDPAASCRRNFIFRYATADSAALLAELTAAVDAARAAGDTFYAYTVDNAGEALAYTSMLLVLRVLLGGFVALVALISAANIANTVSTGLALRGRELAMLQSVGMDPAALRRMVLLQSVFYAFRALGWGLPLGLACLWSEYRLLRRTWSFAFTLPWGAILLAAAGVFALTLLAALPALRTLRRRGLMDALRQEE